MKRQIFTALRLVCFLSGLLLSLCMQSANASQSNIFNKIDDRKMYGLTGKVVEARYSDGTLMKFDKTGKLIRLNGKKFAYQDSCKYMLEQGIVTAAKLECSETMRREISCDTGSNTEEYIFDAEGRLQEYLVHSYPFCKHQYFYQGTEKWPCKEISHCDTIPSGALTYYYIYLETDEAGNWLQRSVKVSGGKDISINRMYVETRRLKYDLAPVNLIASVKGEVKFGSYDPDRLNINKQDKQAAYDRGKENIELSVPKKVEVGEEFEIVFDMKRRPKDVGVNITEQFEPLNYGSQSYEFRTNTLLVAGDTVTQYQLLFKLKAKQKGNLELPSLKARFGGKLNISAPLNIVVVNAQSVLAKKDYNPVVRLVATLNKDTVRMGESAFLSLKLCTTYTKVTSVRLSQPKVSSCTVMEIPVDSIIWKPVSFEDVTYHVGEYKKFQLTPMKAGKVEIPHFWYDCTLSRWGANPKFANGIGNAHGLLGVIGAAVTVVSTSPVRLEKRNESVHTDPLYLEVLP